MKKYYKLVMECTIGTWFLNWPIKIDLSFAIRLTALLTLTPIAEESDRSEGIWLGTSKFKVNECLKINAESENTKRSTFFVY